MVIIVDITVMHLITSLFALFILLSQPADIDEHALHACHSTRSLRLSNTNLLSVLFVSASFDGRSFSAVSPKMCDSLPLSPFKCVPIHIV